MYLPMLYAKGRPLSVWSFSGVNGNDDHFFYTLNLLEISILVYKIRPSVFNELDNK